MPSLAVQSAAIAVLFALIHVFGVRLKFLQVTPRSIWLSVAGGVSVAYVFVHLLPELAAHQVTLGDAAETPGGLVAAIETHSYLIALIGLATFYGLDRMARLWAHERKRGDGEGSPAAVFWIHLGGFALYNFLIGYLLMHREEAGEATLLTYGLAMALHFLVNDQGLREHHGSTYDRLGRWILAPAPLAGWAVGLATSISEVLLAACFAFLAGGVILNVLKEELPDDRESRFWAFAAGAAAYAALLFTAR